MYLILVCYNPQTLVDALQKLYPRDTAAEQALVVALSSAVCAVGGGPEVKQQAEQEAFRQLCQPLHAGLVARNQVRVPAGLVTAAVSYLMCMHMGAQYRAVMAC